jgi:uncharacterized protein YebE (UPF0316 family)
VEIFIHLILPAFLIFICRVADMSIDTLRIMSSVKGQRFRAAAYGFMEAAIFIFALTQLMKPPVHMLHMLGYALGFAVGSMTGTMLASKMAAGYLMFRIMSRDHGLAICQRLRSEGYAVTLLRGEGRDGPLPVLFSLMRRERGQEAFELIQEVDPRAFVVTENIDHAVGGFIPHPFIRGISVRR